MKPAARVSSIFPKTGVSAIASRGISPHAPEQVRLKLVCKLEPCHVGQLEIE